MGTRPMVHRAEVARAIVMIARRRAKVDDRHRDLLSDSEDSDPREVLDYLRKFSGPDIPRWVLQAEVSDALTLNNWLWWEDRRRELFFLKAGRARGICAGELAPVEMRARRRMVGRGGAGVGIATRRSGSPRPAAWRVARPAWHRGGGVGGGSSVDHGGWETIVAHPQPPRCHRHDRAAVAGPLGSRTDVSDRRR